MARVVPDARMTLGAHLDELRRRIILALLGVAVGMAIAFIFNRQVFQVLFWPLWMGTRGQPPKLYYQTLASAFSVYFQVCLIFGLIISSPYVIYQLWQFVARGLYENERRVVRRIVLPSAVLFLAGVAFYFLIVSPAVVYFLLDFGNTAYPSPGQWHLPWVDWIVPASPMPPPASQPMAGDSFVAPMLTLSEYINFTVLMGLIFGLAFQTPLVIVFLARTGIVPFQTLKKSRKYVLFICLVVALFATPGQDIFSNTAMTLAMYLLFELGMLVLAMGGRKSQPSGRSRE